MPPKKLKSFVHKMSGVPAPPPPKPATHRYAQLKTFTLFSDDIERLKNLADLVGMSQSAVMRYLIRSTDSIDPHEVRYHKNLDIQYRTLLRSIALNRRKEA